MQPPKRRPRKKRKAPSTAKKRRLSRKDWINHALVVLARGSLADVAVEPMTESLGVTKGSFYWHFEDRAELVTAALERWEYVSTTVVINFLEKFEPRERLRRLIRLGYEDRDIGMQFATLAADANDPLVEPALRRVSEARLEFLNRTYRALGFSPARARHSSLLAYSAYVGLFHLQRAAPRKSPIGAKALGAYLDYLVGTLVPP